jgi:hypothetical protein
MEVRRTPHAAYLDDLLMKGRRTPPIPRGQTVEWRALSGRASFQAALFRHLVHLKKLTESDA